MIGAVLLRRASTAQGHARRWEPIAETNSSQDQEATLRWSKRFWKLSDHNSYRRLQRMSDEPSRMCASRLPQRLRRLVSAEALVQMPDAVSSVASEDGVRDFKARQERSISRRHRSASTLSRRGRFCGSWRMGAWSSRPRLILMSSTTIFAGRRIWGGSLQGPPFFQRPGRRQGDFLQSSHPGFSTEPRHDDTTPRNGGGIMGVYLKRWLPEDHGDPHDLPAYYTVDRLETLRLVLPWWSIASRLLA